MILTFKQKALTFLGRYKVYDENGNEVYDVQGRFSIPKKFEVYDNSGREVGSVKGKYFDFFPTFNIFKGGECVGYIKKGIKIFGDKFNINFNNWTVDGDIFGWNYTVADENNNLIATLSKHVVNLFDVYTLDIVDPKDALDIMLLAIAIDMEKANQ